MADQKSANVKAQFGVHGVPTKAKKVWVRDMAFDHDGVNKNADGTTTTKIETKSWILIREDDRRCHLNTYDGKIGSKVDPDTFTYDALDDKGMAKKLKIGKPGGYREVPVSECPFAVAIVEEVKGEDPKEETPAPEAKTEETAPAADMTPVGTPE